MKSPTGSPEATAEARPSICPDKWNLEALLRYSTDGNSMPPQGSTGESIHCDLGCSGPEVKSRHIGRFTLPAIFDYPACPRSGIRSEAELNLLELAANAEVK